MAQSKGKGGPRLRDPACAGDFAPQLRDALTREFWIGEGLLTQRTRSPDAGPDKSAGQVRGKGAMDGKGNRDSGIKGLRGE